MPVFFSKKQKAEFRKRRRRVKDAAKKDGRVNELADDGADNGGAVEKEEEEPTSNVVLVPKNLSSQEARKFRKDARRKARSEGKDCSSLEFVVEGSKPTAVNGEKESTNHDTKTNKKRKREFPRLNDLVKEEATAKAKKQESEARKSAEGALSDSYKRQFVALDCEMVGIGTDGKKSALARVSIVDWDGHVILDTFVQVPSRVTDFRTHVSGVTAKDIQRGSGAIKESECRVKVANILEGKILVGHALKNDFSALMLTHPKENIRDTAKYKLFQRLGGGKWRPRKLRDIAKENLDLTIQKDGQAHDSIQDARATMQLYRLAREKWEQDLDEKKASKRRKMK